MLIENQQVHPAVAYAESGLNILLLNGRFFRKNSRGIKEATKNPAVIKKWLDEDYSLNPYLVTGKANRIVVVEVTILNDKEGRTIVNGVAELIKYFRGTGVNLSDEIMASLKTSASNCKFHLYFCCGDETIYTREAVLPGVSIYGEYGYVPLPSSTYLQGNRHMAWEFDSANDQDVIPHIKSLMELKFIPEWVRELPNLESPFYAIWKAKITADQVMDQCLAGVSGDDAVLKYHDMLCRLRGFGMEKMAFFDYAENCALASKPQFSPAWAKEFAQYIWDSYQPVKNVPVIDYGKRALEASLEY